VLESEVIVGFIVEPLGAAMRIRNSDRSRGFDIGQFTSVLGPALFIRWSDKRDVVEYTFRGRDFWVQALADPRGLVDIYSATSCDPSFTPTFDPFPGRVPRVTLQRTPLSAIRTHTTVDYSFSGATGNSHVAEDYYGTNAYQTFRWDVDDACPPLLTGTVSPDPYAFVGDRDVAPRWYVRSRHTFIVNTYTESTIDWQNTLDGANSARPSLADAEAVRLGRRSGTFRSRSASTES